MADASVPRRIERAVAHCAVRSKAAHARGFAQRQARGPRKKYLHRAGGVGHFLVFTLIIFLVRVGLGKEDTHPDAPDL